jgi:phage terminase large subunit-like protein
VREIAVPDDHTVVLHLNDPETGFVPMLAQVSTWTAKIYPKHLWEGQDGFESGPHLNAPVGSGPFKFVRWEKGGVVELEANPDYFRGKPKLDRLIYRPMADINVARAEFDAGRLHYLPYDYAPPLAEVPALRRNNAVKVVFTPSHFSRDIQLNLARPPLDKREVRQAIGHAIDREAMNKLAFNGLWKPAIHASVESQGEWINRSAKFPEYDKAKAEKLLDEAGLPRKADGWRFAVTVTPPNFVDCKAMMEVLVQQLRQVGINAKLRHLLLLHPLWAGPRRLSRALRHRRRPQLPELLRQGAGRDRDQGLGLPRQGRAEENLRPHPGDRRPRPALHQPVRRAEDDAGPRGLGRLHDRGVGLRQVAHLVRLLRGASARAVIASPARSLGR